MKRLVLLAVCGALMLGAFVPLTTAKSEGAATTFKLDRVHSTVVFRITHLDASAFWGRFNDPEGSFVLSDDGLSVNVTIDVNKIDTGNKMRDDHLRGPDYFNVAEFPKATFKSTGATKTGDNEWSVTGDLTIRGKTKSVSLTMAKIGESRNEDPRAGHRAGIEGELNIKRSEFGIGQPEGLGDDVRLIIALEGKE